MKINTTTKAGIMKLSGALENAQVHCRARCLTVEQILDTINRIDSFLPLSKSAKCGVVAYVDYHARHFPNAYNAIPYSTHFIMKNNGRGVWFVTSIYRGICGPTDKEVRFEFTPEAREELIKYHETARL